MLATDKTKGKKKKRRKDKSLKGHKEMLHFKCSLYWTQLIKILSIKVATLLKSHHTDDLSQKAPDAKRTNL